VPWVITAGTYKKKESEFLGRLQKNAIIVELKDSYFTN
jgi:hypothetical protein